MQQKKNWLAVSAAIGLCLGLGAAFAQDALAPPAAPEIAAVAPQAEANEALAPAAIAGPHVLKEASIAIADAFPDLAAGQNRIFRTQILELAPGARTPLLSHQGRPAITYITAGAVVEHRDGLAEPIPHALYAATLDRAGTSHYWENVGAEPARLLIVDLIEATP